MSLSKLSWPCQKSTPTQLKPVRARCNCGHHFLIHTQNTTPLYATETASRSNNISACTFQPNTRESEHQKVSQAPTSRIPLLKHAELFKMEYWRWGLMTLVLMFGHLTSGWMYALTERHIWLWRKVLYFVYGLKKGVHNALSLTLASVMWALTFDKVK